MLKKRIVNEFLKQLTTKIENEKDVTFSMEKYVIDLKKIGFRIKELRRLHGATQEVFSSSIYISTSYLALIETGKRTASLDVFAQIAHTYHVSLDYLLFGIKDSAYNSNQLLFNSLCERYTTDDISSALALAEFYLNHLVK